jgi:cell fate (sporulation/competence/biofilm development) regulator YlbF (YheA/YmcA/DUF963 family)
MDLQLHAFPSRAMEKLDPLQAAQVLGQLLCETPEYNTLIQALQAKNSDLTLLKLSAEMRSHQTALRWGNDPDGQHAAEMTRLELEMEDMPVVKAYRQAEQDVSVLFRAVDEIISSEAGLDFAVNAQRTGCSCSR